MEFYYKTQIEHFKPKCPPEEYAPTERKSYRWVFGTITDEKNFLAQAEKNPKILNSKTDSEKCAAYALSFHRSAKESHDHFNYLVGLVCRNDRELAYTRFGKNIATGVLTTSCGVAGKIEPNGHFNFHHIKNHQFFLNFEIIEGL